MRYLLAILLAFSTLLAKPTVNAVGGTMADGQQLVVTGSGFGGGPTVVIWDDFESGTSGADVALGEGSAVIGEWGSFGDLDACDPSEQDQQPKYDDRHPRSGGMAFHFGGPGGCARTGLMIHDLDADDVFIHEWLYIPRGTCIPGPPDNSCGNSNWKTNWLLGPHKSTTINDRIVLGTDGGRNIRSGSNSAANSFWLRGMQFRFDRYQLWQFHLNPGPTGVGPFWAGGIDGRTFEVWANDRKADLQKTRNQSKWTGKYHYLDIGGYGRGEARGKTVLEAFYDDIYVAVGPNAQSRVEIINAASREEATDLSLCTTGGSADSWDEGTINCTVRGGRFENGTEVWVHVVDTDGNVSNAFGPILWAGSSDPACGDGADNDGDGKIDCNPDHQDEGCYDTFPGGTCSTTAVDERYCGDGRVDTNEKCDGDSLGEASCLTRGFETGALVCAPDCKGFDTSGCETSAILLMGATPHAERGPGASLTYTHDQQTDFLVVSVASAPVPDEECVVTGVTYGGKAMTLSAHAATKNHRAQSDIYHLADPGTGENEVTVTFKGRCKNKVSTAATGLSNVNKSAGVVGSASKAWEEDPKPPLAAAVKDVEVNDLCIDSLATNAWNNSVWERKPPREAIYEGEGAASSLAAATRDKMQMTWHPNAAGKVAALAVACFRRASAP